jgi:AAA15 family ATPase/GTPase
MIESILIKNFRGIQTGQIDRFRKFNLLVGPNNSGKSTVLEALYLATTADRPARITIPRLKSGHFCFYRQAAPLSTRGS